MKLKALRSLDGGRAYGFVTSGQEFETGEAAGKRLVDRGLAVEVKPEPHVAKPAGKNRGAKAPLDGSPTGGAKPASSSAAAPRPKASGSKKPAAGRGSSSSTKAGG